MIERFEKYFESLELLSTEQLDHSMEKLVRAEKKSTALVIAHIAEMSRRKGALERGYKNLFDYCVRRLNLSEGSVARRLQVANVARRFPQILVALAENRISLTVAGMLTPHLDEANVEKRIGDCAGMTKRAVEEYLVRLRPKPVFEPLIRRQPAPAPAPIGAEKVSAPKLEVLREPARRPTPPVLAPATPERFNFRFSADRKFKEKLERLAEVLGVENVERQLAEVLENAVDAALDRKDPKRKRARRIEREKRATARQKSRPGEISERALQPSRYIASKVRERVHERAGHQCEYRSDGTRCPSRTGLQIEHTRPFAIFRSHDERFLRLLCPRHNRFRADQVYGAAFVKAKIEEKNRSFERRAGRS